MNNLKSLRALALATIAVGMLSILAMAQSPKKSDSISAVALDRKGLPVSEQTELKWKINKEFASLVLTVSTPDGEVLRREFNSGELPSFKLVDDKGSVLADGQYVYELRLAPKLDSEVTEALAAAREREMQDAERDAELKSDSGEKTDSAAIQRQFQKSGKLSKEPITLTGGFLIEKGVVYMSVSGDQTKAASEASSKDPKVSQQRMNPQFDSMGRTPVFAPAAMAAFDQVIADDLIVQGSACVGFDCVNGESFSFDTIRLKENNLRIKFEDTSAAGFPSNDWQLTANDSSAGGANKFSIEDITGAKVPFTITAGAANNSIFVDSSGRLGLRTATPVLDVHVNTSNTPAHRLEQNNSGGFTAQTWDIAGNEANFFVRDVTGGSRLPFRIRPGAPTSSIDIAATGKVGIGTASPAEKLHVAGTANTNAVFEGGAATHSLVKFRSATTDRGFIGFANVGATGLSFFNAAGGTVNLLMTDGGNLGLGGQTSPTSPVHHANGATLSAGGAWINGSSRVLKNDIRNLSTRDAFAALQQLTPVTFRYKTEPTQKHVGFIAEDVPDLVATTDRKGLSSMDIVAVLTKVVQEQQQTIAELKVKVEQLEKANVKKAKLKRKR
ncbi:MAG: tail fiber domain-containing protein [Blastocatellia bacterium]